MPRCTPACRSTPPAASWEDFADHFTEDAEYVEHAFGTFRGRDQIREWSVRTMTSYPGGEMTGFPLAWQVVDEPTSRLICEVRNLMPDPGDGSHHEESNLTIMTYAGDGLFSREEDVYNPLRFLKMSVRWARIAEEHGRLSHEGRRVPRGIRGLIGGFPGLRLGRVWEAPSMKGAR